jgi:hypothetical protein
MVMKKKHQIIFGADLLADPGVKILVFEQRVTEFLERNGSR